MQITLMVSVSMGMGGNKVEGVSTTVRPQEITMQTQNQMSKAVVFGSGVGNGRESLDRGQDDRATEMGHKM